jgi:hypothetical protein
MGRVRQIEVTGALLLGAAAGVCAAQPGRGAATSVYTGLDLRRCVRTGSGEEESDAWRCPGYRGVPLFVLYGDGRYDLDAGADNGLWESRAGPNAPPARVEWRLRGGQPRAIIYRLRLTGEGDAGRSVLAVETVGRPGRWAGCLVAWVDGDVANANAIARARADGDHSRFRCGHDEPEEVARRARTSP